MAAEFESIAGAQFLNAMGAAPDNERAASVSRDLVRVVQHIVEEEGRHVSGEGIYAVLAAAVAWVAKNPAAIRYALKTGDDSVVVRGVEEAAHITVGDLPLLKGKLYAIDRSANLGVDTAAVRALENRKANGDRGIWDWGPDVAIEALLRYMRSDKKPPPPPPREPPIRVSATPVPPITVSATPVPPITVSPTPVPSREPPITVSGTPLPSREPPPSARPEPSKTREPPVSASLTPRPSVRPPPPPSETPEPLPPEVLFGDLPGGEPTPTYTPELDDAYDKNEFDQDRAKTLLKYTAGGLASAIGLAAMAAWLGRPRRRREETLQIDDPSGLSPEQRALLAERHARGERGENRGEEENPFATVPRTAAEEADLLREWRERIGRPAVEDDGAAAADAAAAGPVRRMIPPGELEDALGGFRRVADITRDLIPGIGRRPIPSLDKMRLAHVAQMDAETAFRSMERMELNAASYRRGPEEFHDAMGPPGGGGGPAGQGLPMSALTLLHRRHLAHSLSWGK